MSNKILILGGARFHGRQLAEDLAAGNEVYVLNRGRCTTDYPKYIQQLVADRNIPEQLQAAIGVTHFDAVIDNNAYHPAQVETILDSLKDRCGHYIFTSTAAVYLTHHADHRLREEEATGILAGPYSPMVQDYALAKFAAEEMLRRKFHHLPYTILRPPNIFGAGDFLGKISFFYHRFKEGAGVLLEEEVDSFSLVWVQDVVRIMSSVIQNKNFFGKTVNLADPAVYDYDILFSTLLGNIFSAKRVVRMPAQAMWKGGYFLPLAWGPLLDTTLLLELLRDVRFTPLASWGRSALCWELAHFGERSCDPAFVRSRQLELDLIKWKANG